VTDSDGHLSAATPQALSLIGGVDEGGEERYGRAKP
jgi:hypothetical protein